MVEALQSYEIRIALEIEQAKNGHAKKVLRIHIALLV